MSWTLYTEQLNETAKSIDKSIRLHTHNNICSRIISWCLFLLSFGSFKKQTFLNKFALTLGNHIFLPEQWSYDIVFRILVHEGRHVKQFRWFGLGIHPLVGILPMGIVYLLFPFPFLLAFGRFFLELDADKTMWKYLKKRGFWPNPAILNNAETRAISLSNINYFYSIPKKLSKYIYLKEARKITNE